MVKWLEVMKVAWHYRRMDSNRDTVSAEATLTAQGRLAIPREVRDAAGLEPGAKIHITVEPDGVLRLETWEQKARRVRASLAATLTGKKSLSDELVADRRSEAAREDAV